jgi:aspartate/methionine/tyrosine aminotransferase
VSTSFLEFQLERWMSVWEPRVQINLCDSGVAPVSVGELLALSNGSLEDLSTLRLAYGTHNGSLALREAIASQYSGATSDHVLVTSGSAEGMFLLCWLLLERGDRVVIPTPAYEQTSGLARNLGAHVVPLPLVMDHGWEPDPSDIRAAIAPGTRLVIITNPHNPSGHVLSGPACEMIVQRAAEVGAWLIIDEIYLGAELQGVTPRSLWGGYERLIVTSGLSKTYGLPGLRIGWIVGAPRVISDAWARHDYTVLAPNIIGDCLARHALSVREPLQARGRGILAQNWPRLEERLRRLNKTLDNRLQWGAPHAGGIAFVRYDHPMESERLADRLRDGWSVLIAPGDHFGSPRHFRIGIGGDPAEYPHALDGFERAFLNVLG